MVQVQSTVLKLPLGSRRAIVVSNCHGEQLSRKQLSLYRCVCSPSRLPRHVFHIVVEYCTATEAIFVTYYATATGAIVQGADVYKRQDMNYQKKKITNLHRTLTKIKEQKGENICMKRL